MYDNILAWDIKHFLFIGRTTLKYDHELIFFCHLMNKMHLNVIN